MFHTEQVWILSRDTIASDSVVQKARQVLSNQVPSYDQDGKFLLIEQGDTCTYKVPQVDAAESEMNDIIAENDSLETAEGEDEGLFNASPNVGATAETDLKFLNARSQMT